MRCDLDRLHTATSVSDCGFHTFVDPGFQGLSCCAIDHSRLAQPHTCNRFQPNCLVDTAAGYLALNRTYDLALQVGVPADCAALNLLAARHSLFFEPIGTQSRMQRLAHQNCACRGQHNTVRNLLHRELLLGGWAQFGTVRRNRFGKGLRVAGACRGAGSWAQLGADLYSQRVEGSATRKRSRAFVEAARHHRRREYQ
jgi:hypothetical protein